MKAAPNENTPHTWIYFIVHFVVMEAYWTPSPAQALPGSYSLGPGCWGTVCCLLHWDSLSWDWGNGVFQLRCCERNPPWREHLPFQQCHPKAATTRSADPFSSLFSQRVLIPLLPIHRPGGWGYRSVSCKPPARQKLVRSQLTLMQVQEAHVNSTICTQWTTAWLLLEMDGRRWIRTCFTFIKKIIT